MSQIYEKAMGLLGEIDKICTENGIRYFLGAKSIYQLEQKQIIGDGCNFDVLIPTEDIKKFVKAASGDDSDRYELESMMNNGNYLGFTLRYVDSSTTVICFANGTNIKSLGLGVEIVPIRKAQKGRKIKAVNFLERGWESNGFNKTSNLAKKHRLGAQVIGKSSAVLGKQNVGRKLFGILIKENAGAIGSKRVSIRLPQKHERVVRGKYFLEPERIEIKDGLSVNVPSDREDFMCEYYGIHWRDEGFEEVKPNEVVLGDVPYRAYIKGCKDNGVDLDDFFKLKQRNVISRRSIDEYTKRSRQVVLLARRSGDRLNLYEKLKPVMPKIQKAYEEKDVVTLRGLLAENEERTLFYLDNKLGLCVNEVCLNAQALIFEQTGRKGLAERLLKLAPKEHYKSIIE